MMIWWHMRELYKKLQLVDTVEISLILELD